MEIWKDVFGYEDCYEISSYGQLRSKDHLVPCKNGKTRLVKGKQKKLFTNDRGYLITTLSQRNKLKTFVVHQLVAQAFLPGYAKGVMVNHIDGNKQNNCINNLELSDSSHNQLHAVRTGLKIVKRTSQYRHVSYINNPKAKSRWAVCIKHNGKGSFGWKTFTDETEAAKYADQLLDSIGDTQRLRNFP